MGGPGAAAAVSLCADGVTSGVAGCEAEGVGESGGGGGWAGGGGRGR